MHAQNDLNLHSSCIFKFDFLLDVAHYICSSEVKGDILFSDRSC